MEKRTASQSTFSALHIAPKLVAILESRNLKNPTPIQEQCIPLAIEGKDIVGIAQTGTGKTLAFGLPIIQRLAQIGGQALILLPTRELALQVDEVFQKIGRSIGLRTAVLIGGTSSHQQKKLLEKNPHIVISTPGRLNDHLQQRNYSLCQVKILVLDEADRMLDIGFLPQIRKILESTPKERQTLMFSATMPQAIAEIAAKHMKIPLRIEVAPTGTAAENVEQEIFIVEKESKMQLLDPNSAGDPGLVFNSGFGDWLGFLCGTQLPTSFCTSAGVPVLDPSNFNTAAIAIGDLAGVQTVTRKVTNVGANAETYTASYTGLAGITVALPGSFTVAKGATQSFNVTFTTAGAALNSYVGGQFTLTGSNGHVVRIPVVVRPVALAAPTQVSGSYNVTFGYNGPFTATASGLVPATTFSGSISTGEFLEYEMTIPAGTTYARVSLFDANVSPASDLDMYLFDSAGVQVGYSGSGTSAEEINLTNPAAGTYYILVEGYGTANPSTFTGFYWTLGSTAAGNMTVTAPANAVIGQTGAINLSFSGLSAETKYLGSIAYGGAAGMPAPTIVRVDP